jgi:AbrB family looped-hinge helix DNA binding protein
MLHPHPPSSAGLPSSHRVRMGSDGRIVIPADIRHHIGAVAGDEFTVEADATGIRLKTIRQLVAEAQAYFTEGLAAGELVSEELRRERRAEAARE